MRKLLLLICLLLATPVYAGGFIGGGGATGLSVVSGKTLTVNNSLTLAGTDATTMTFPGASDTLAGIGTAQTFTKQNTFAAGTLTISQPLTVTQTWNNGATTFTGIQENITNLASASNSLLLDLQVGGASRFQVTPSGGIYGSGGIGFSLWSTSPGSGAIKTAMFISGGVGNLAASSDSSIGFNSGADINVGALDTKLFRDAAGIFGCRNGTTSCGFDTSGTALTMSAGEIGLGKITASGSAPGAAGGKFELVCGTGAGTAKLIVYAGTSTTPVTIVDNIGSGVTGC